MNAYVAMAMAGAVVTLIGVVLTFASMGAAQQMGASSFGVPVGILFFGGSLMLKGIAGCMSDIERFLEYRFGSNGVAIAATVFILGFLCVTLGGMAYWKYLQDSERQQRKSTKGASLDFSPERPRLAIACLSSFDRSVPSLGSPL